MARSYDEIMGKIEVTPEMRQRVLERVAQEIAVSSKVVRFPAWRKYLPVAACLALLLVGAAVLPHLLHQAEPGPPVLTVPDIVEAASMEELSELVGFEVTADVSLPFEVKDTTCCSYWNEMAQIQYTGEAQTATYRQSLGTDDNSGDYNTYSDTIEIAVSDRTVTLKGNSGSYVLAVWTDGTYAYSLSITPGVSEEGWRAIISPLPQ